MNKQTILNFIKKTDRHLPLTAGYITYGLSKSKFSFFLLIFLVICSVIALLIELISYYRQEKTIKKAFSFGQWFDLVIGILILIVAIFAPREVLYH